MAAKKNKPKRYAYARIESPDGGSAAGPLWIVVLCEENLHGYRLVDDYGPYEDEKRADGVVDRLNARNGISRKVALKIVRSTIPISTRIAGMRAVPS